VFIQFRAATGCSPCSWGGLYGDGRHIGDNSTSGYSEISNRSPMTFANERAFARS